MGSALEVRQADPAEQSTRIDVEVLVGRVWEVVREVERWPEGAPTVTSVRRLDDGPLAVGSRVPVEHPRIPTEYVVTELKPGRSFSARWPPAWASAPLLGTRSKSSALAARVRRWQ